MQYIPWLFSFCSLIVAILSLAHTKSKDRTSEIREDTEKFDSIEKSLLKANIKLDTVCRIKTDTVNLEFVHPEVDNAHKVVTYLGIVEVELY